MTSRYNEHMRLSKVYMSHPFAFVLYINKECESRPYHRSTWNVWRTESLVHRVLVQINLSMFMENSVKQSQTSNSIPLHSNFFPCSIFFLLGGNSSSYSSLNGCSLQKTVWILSTDSPMSTMHGEESRAVSRVWEGSVQNVPYLRRN